MAIPPLEINPLWRIHPRRSLPGHGFGERSGRDPGGRTTFLDHRSYQQGDDPRQIDWRATARLERPILRRAAADTGLEVTVVVDATQSMRGLEKFLEDAMAVLEKIFRRQGDRVKFLVDGGSEGRGLTRPSSLLCQGRDDPEGLARDLNALCSRPGMLLFFSDALGDGDKRAFISQLWQQGHDCLFFHCLPAPALIWPASAEVIDEESGERLIIDQTKRKEFERVIKQDHHRWQEESRRTGFRYRRLEAPNLENFLALIPGLNDGALDQ